MSVEISPSAQLGFPRPLTQVVKRSLFLTNSNSQPVAFKVKTTAPKQYCVRPNSGRLEAGERVEVQVLLQPLKEEPPMSAKCRDKFLIQSAIITPEKETIPIADFWVQQETQKDAIAEHKIRCVYLPPSSETVPEENEDLSNVSGMGTGAPSYASAGVPSGPGLGELEAEVLRLRAQVAAQSNAGVSKSTATVTSSGVPVHIVAAIAVGVFAVTYLFF